MSDPCDLEECLSDSRLTDSQRHMLAVALRYHRAHMDRLGDKVESASEKIDAHISHDVPEIRDNLKALNRAMWATANHPQEDEHAKTPALMDLSRQICMISRLGAIAWTAVVGMQGYVLYILGKLWGSMP